jgi:tetratricopeptide (TPR) repeat protein
MDIHRLIELVKEAEPYSECDRLESARVLINRGRVSFFGEGNVKLALEDMAIALRIFEEENSFWDAALALVGVGMYHSLLGEPHKGIAESLRSITLFEELGDFRFQMEACWPAGENFCNLGLNREALGMFGKIIEIDEKLKMGDYNRLVYANALSARPYELINDWEKALSYCLKALEASKKTDNLIAPGIVYANLSRIYVRLGDLKHAEEYFDKFMKLPSEVQMNVFVDGSLSKAVFFAGKSQWKESNQFFKERLFDEVAMPMAPTPVGAEIYGRLFYAWALEKQGLFDEARIQLEEVQKASREIEERFAHVRLQANLMVRREVRVGEELKMRLDLVNASRKPGLLVKAEGLIPPDGFKITALPTHFKVQNFCLEMKNMEIDAFQVATAILNLVAVKTGTFTINPKIIYLDELGETKTCNLKPVKIHVETGPLTINEEKAMPNSLDRFEFKSELTQKAFDYLVNVFVEDYMRLRIAQEKAGWRSLMRIVEEGKLSKSSMYGYGGRRGRALIELESRGLVEARFFPGERGRGGKILKLRVAYEKEIIKRIIDNRIMNRKNQ